MYANWTSLANEHVTNVASAHRDCPGESAEDARARVLSLGVARGERERVGEFYEAWFEWVLAAASRATTRDEAFCLDVVQDVMLRVAAKMPAMSTHAQLERWMWRVTFNAAMDALRSEQRRRKREQARAGVTAQAVENDAGAIEERCDWLRKELSRLDSEEHVLVRARFAGNMSLKEIGSGLGRTTGAVHGKLRTAIARLKRRAEETGHDE
ncbi:MAG: sigma-70 family RNA polymerase sigma factor [Phycisphaeraceae bacterium]|nr:sigma-70 family RNA polymerase sigma factor [Phycisphaeraceae bacterium]MCW5762107.1 sigma-70 family RNA polymerase sigma factor [Phycisphaeraceae bacterium]